MKTGRLNQDVRGKFATWTKGERVWVYQQPEPRDHVAYFRRMARAAILHGHTFTPVESKE